MFHNLTSLSSSMAYRILTLILLIGLVLSPGFLQAVQAADHIEKTSLIRTQGPAHAGDSLPWIAQSIDESAILDTGEGSAPVDLPPDASDNWWANVQADIRQSEYHISWVEPTYLSDLGAAYQAPNRAQNLRTYFTPQGIRIIPRAFEGDIPPWEWGLTLSGYGYAGDIQPVTAPSLEVQEQRIEYHREGLTEWYINDERGLEQGFTLHEPTSPSQGENERIVLDLNLSGNLTSNLTDNGTAVELTAEGGVHVLRYGELAVSDAQGRLLSAHMELVEHGIHITLDIHSAIYPIIIASVITGLPSSPSWFAESNQTGAWFGTSVGTAGDVNGDGYSDVIIGAQYFDNGELNEGRAFVYHGSVNGLETIPAWTAESDQAHARFGWSVGIAGDVNGDGYSDVVVGSPDYDGGERYEGRAYVYHGSASGLSAAADWEAEVDQENAQYGWSVGTAGDVNDDGYSDVVVSAYLFDNEQYDEGATFVYHGSTAGLSLVPDWMAESDQAFAFFGFSVGTAGDVNGDGYSDLIVGAYNYSGGQTDEGRAYVYHGSAAGLAPAPDWIAELDHGFAHFGWSVGTAGDVNGDGYSDVIVGAPVYIIGQVIEGHAYVYQGSAVGLAPAPDWIAECDQGGARFGWSVGTAGDVNGDGYSDVIVGAPLYANNYGPDAGKAYLYRGGAGGLNATPDWTAESDQGGAQFSISVGTAGDVNGDGYSDVIIGAPWYDNDETDEGRAYVYHGSDDGVSAFHNWMGESNLENSYYGFSVGTAGDVNGDGYSDVIVGALEYENGQLAEGRAYVYHGSASGLSIAPSWTAESNQAGSLFGMSVGTAGDVNGDGYSDVIIGAPFYHNSEGRVYVYHGSADGLSSSPNWIVESNQASSDFGRSVGTAGDVNGDGYSDVIIGAPIYDDGEYNEGRAYVYHGSAGGLSASPDWTAEGNQVSANLGNSVGTAGDVNGDGYSDVLVGAYFYSNGQDFEGRAYVYHGSAGGLSTTPDWMAEGDQAEAWFGYSVGTAGDVNGDGYSDVVVGARDYDNGEYNEGRVFVYLGGAGGLSTTPDWTAEGDQEYARLGESVGTAGDVNGDGYSDVLIGVPGFANAPWGQGRADIYYGSAAGLGASADWSAGCDQIQAGFGVSVGTAGDVNGDGYGDVIIGAFIYDNGEEDEGAAFTYYGNGGDGLHLLPRQLRSDGSAPIDHLGSSDIRTAFQLSLIGRMPLGREEVKLHWQVAPLGVPITSTHVISGTSGWTDVLTTGVEITQTVTGLTLDTPYHWRVRLLYSPGNALGQTAGRWVHIPWAGWNETDLRTSQNQPPLADAGTDQAVNRNEIVSLDGIASSDPDGDYPLTYLWTQTGGPEVTLSDPEVVTPTFTAPSDPAVLTFTLAVTDSLGLPGSASDDVVVTVTNQPPLANAGDDQNVERNATVTLDGSDSSDPDGDYPLSYLWKQIGGPGVVLSDPTVVTPTFTAPPDPSVLTFTLAVTDSLGLADSTPDEVIVTVINQPPIADAGDDQTVGTDAVVTLDGSGSSDPDGDYPLSYLWVQIGGPEVVLSDPTLVTPTFTAPSDPSVLTFTLTVTDSLGLADPTPDEVVVAVGNQPPVADAGEDQSVSTGAVVTLDGSSSSDPDGDYPLSYLWDQTGGLEVTLSDSKGITPIFTAPSDPAVLTFSLAVTDSLDLPGFTSDEVVVTVNNQPPVADAGVDQTVSKEAVVMLDGSASSDPDGDYPLTYLWTQTGGPGVVLSDPTVVMPVFNAPADPAMLTFILTVTDSLGLADPTPDEVRVIIDDLDEYLIYLPITQR